jgi:prefoldin subunit 5
MNDIAEKYVAKALEGYEANYQGISDAITQLEAQLEDFNAKREEMKEGIDEMRELLGLGEEEELGGNATPLTLVSEEHGNSDEE